MFTALSYHLFSFTPKMTDQRAEDAEPFIKQLCESEVIQVVAATRPNLNPIKLRIVSNSNTGTVN